MTPRRLAACGVVALLCLRSTPVLAFSIGIVGFSGKQHVLCTSCHAGGVTPTVTLAGPTTLGPAETGTYTFTVHSNAASQVAAGLDVAASAGLLGVVNGQDEQRIGGEVTHTQPQNNDADGNAMWTFTWQAPAVPGDYTLFAAGNSVNLSGTTSGDRAAATTLIVSTSPVMASSTPTPSPTSTPLPVNETTPTPVIECTGDCNDDGVVTIDEILALVSIALGDAELSSCRAGDANGDGMISVDEILIALNNALNGCGAAV